MQPRRLNIIVGRIRQSPLVRTVTAHDTDVEGARPVRGNGSLITSGDKADGAMEETWATSIRTAISAAL